MENKAAYVELIEAILLADDRSHVTSCVYSNENGFDRTEYVTIWYKGGAMAKINVSANSLGAILKEVAAEVYGNGALGRVFYGFPKDK